MAVSESLLLKRLSGHLGREIVFRQYGDKTVVSKYPDMSKRVLSAKQLRINEIMEEANYEARSILADEALRNAAQVRLNVTRNKLYTSLIKEYFKNALQETEDPSGKNEKETGVPAQDRAIALPGTTGNTE